MAEFDSEPFKEKLKEAEKSKHIEDLFNEFKDDLDEWRTTEREQPNANKEAINRKYKETLRQFEELKNTRLEALNSIKRKSVYKRAREYGWNITDPDRPNAPIDDYEGWGDRNKFGFGRAALAGYLVGLQFEDPGRAAEAFNLAKNKFESITGSNLSDNEIKEIIGDSYLSQVSWLNITDETKGFLAAYLQLADKRFSDKDEKQAYTDYLLETANGAISKLPPFKFTGSRSEMVKVYQGGNRAEKELDGLEELLSPKEWSKKKKEADEEEETAEEDAPKPKEKITAEGLNVKKAEFSERIEKFKARAEKLDKEQQKKLHDKLFEAEKAVEGYVGYVDSNKIGDLKIKKLKKLEDDAEGRLVGLMFTLDTTEFENKLAAEIAKKPSGKDELPEDSLPPPEGADPYLQEWKHGKEVDNPFEGYTGKLIVKPDLGRNANLRNSEGEPEKALQPGQEVTMEDPQTKGKLVRGEIFVKIKYGDGEYYIKESDFEIKETDKEINAFLETKKLGETKQTNGKYVYFLNERGSKVEDGKFVFHYENPDVQSAFGEKAKEYLAELFKKELTIAEEEAIEKKAAEKKDQTGNLKDIFTDEAKLESFLEKLSPAEKAKWQTVDKLIHEALRDSTLTFSSQPTVEALKKAYDENFKKVWEKAAKRLTRHEKEQTKVVETGKEIIPGLEALGKVNSEYRDAFERIQKDKDSPQGALFHLPFNKTDLECSLKKDKSEYVLSFRNARGGENMRFENLQKALEAINNGEVFRRMTWDMLRDKYYYQQHERKIGDLKDLEPLASDAAKGYMVKLKLDWKAPTFLGGGNPEIWAETGPHGQISYRINRDNIGPVGENVTEGRAANFDDFMRQLTHLRSWAENYDSDKTTDTVTRKEKLFREITNPEAYRGQEKELGRYISFDIFDNEAVQLYLDWGGGSAKDVKMNAMLNVWANNEGTLNYVLNYRGKTNIGTGRAASFKDLTEQIVKIREEIKNPVDKSPSVTDLPAAA